MARAGLALLAGLGAEAVAPQRDVLVDASELRLRGEIVLRPAFAPTLPLLASATSASDVLR